MRNTVLHIQAKVHPAIASISVKFQGMKEDINISKLWKSNFRISYRSRDICLDCRSFIDISDWIVKKIIFTETIIFKRSSLSILLILHLMVLANLYFKDIGSTQTLIFSPNTVFHFLHYSQQSLRHVYFLQFSSISVWPQHFYISLWNLQVVRVNDVPRVIIIALILFGQSKAAYWLRWYKIYVTKVFCIYQKIVSQSFSANSKSHTVSKNLEHTEMACLLSWMSGKETSVKKLYFYKEKDWWRITIIDDSSSYLFLMLFFRINSFPMMKEKLGVKER